jgi:hypothetical protein
MSLERLEAGPILAAVSRLESDDAFAPLAGRDLPKLAIGACRLAIDASGVEDRLALAALRELEEERNSAEAAASMRDLADRLDQEAWEAQDPENYLVVFRQARAASALAFAHSEEPDEAIYEAAHALGEPEVLVQRLPR